MIWAKSSVNYNVLHNLIPTEAQKRISQTAIASYRDFFQQNGSILVQLSIQFGVNCSNVSFLSRSVALKYRRYWYFAS